MQLVVLCAEKPTTSLLKRVVTELPIQLKKIAEDHKYTVTMAPVEGAVLVSDGAITVKISLTSPLLREGKSLVVWVFILISLKAYTYHRQPLFNASIPSKTVPLLYFTGP